MAFARVYSAQTELLSGRIVSVEIDTSRGLNNFSIVGLGDRAVDEARDRVGSALKNSGFESPKTKNQKTVVSLSPADIKKEGSHFDLSIAVGFLIAEGLELDTKLDDSLFVGELGLDGEVRPIKGALAIALSAKENGFNKLFLPAENAKEANLVKNIEILPVKKLTEVIHHIQKATKENTPQKIAQYKNDDFDYKNEKIENDFGDIVGQESAKRGLLIAACGGHNVLLYGPPGTGKTMLAKALAGILPELEEDKCIEVTKIQSIAGTLPHGKLIKNAPFRAPHHTSSYVSVIGGGTFPRPGEVTLAHHGVLFLDEFPEFDRRVIESLREPLEEGKVSIARAKGTATFPAEFLFIGAMNPCPCGYKGSKVKTCTCSMADLIKYKRKLSGPLLDRIDIALYVGEIAYDKLANSKGVPQSENIKAQVEKIRQLSYVRSKNAGIGQKKNGALKSKELIEIAPLTPSSQKTLNECAEKLGLSARSYHRTQKLARTIADISGSEVILPEHILEAIRYRPQFDHF